MPVRKFVLMFDHNGSDEVFVLYGTSEAVTQGVQAMIAEAEKFPNEERPPEMIREIGVIPTNEVACLLDEAWKKAGTDEEQNLLEVLTTLAQGVDVAAFEIGKRREAHRQFQKKLMERIAAGMKRHTSQGVKPSGTKESPTGGSGGPQPGSFDFAENDEAD